MPRTLTLSDEKLNFGNAEKGTTEFKTKDGHATFTAHMKDGKVAKLTAKDSGGHPVKVFSLREAPAEENGSGSGTAPIECWVCIRPPGGLEFCYRVDCKSLPFPIPDPTNIS
jgi:hypothetical protein